MAKRHCTLPGGVIVEIDNPRHQQQVWLRGHYYEAGLLNYIRARYLGGLFIDAGACIGNHTLFFARFCAHYVIAIEPEADNLRRLERNLELSALAHKVTVIPMALSDKPGRGALRQAGRSSGTFTLIDGDQVDVGTLDDLVDPVDMPITLLKLDIQGAELAALRGAQRLLERHHPVLFIELMTAPELHEADAFLGALGYVRGRCFNVSPTYEYKYTGGHNAG